MTILNFPKHRFIPHEWAACCDRCGGIEGELPKDCPGTFMSEERREEVLMGDIDFIWREGWTTFTQAKRNKIKYSLRCDDE